MDCFFLALGRCMAKIVLALSQKATACVLLWVYSVGGGFRGGRKAKRSVPYTALGVGEDKH